MKTAIAIIIALLVIGGGYLLMTKKTQAPVTNPGTTGGTPGALETTNPNPPADTTASTGGAVATPVTVTYTDAGFSPKSVQVAAGSSVTFVNNSSHRMWVAANNHPSHTLYDGTNLQQHCSAGASTSFDECSTAANGGIYSFTFAKAGTFAYHNHTQASDSGTVVVK